MTDDAPSEGPRPSDRRSFLKRLTGEAVQAAGSIAGTTGIVLRSASAASEAAAAELGIGGPGAAEDEARAPAPAPATPPPTPVAAPPTPSPAPPLRPLTARETELLSATSAVIAVNGVDGLPHLTRAPFHWDGEVARLLGQLFGARIANIERDGRIAVLVEGATGWVSLSGEARVVAGPAAFAEATPLVAHVHPGEPPGTVWAKLEAAAPQAVIVLRPAKIVSQAG
jgi:hypothetical protein